MHESVQRKLISKSYPKVYVNGPFIPLENCYVRTLMAQISVLVHLVDITILRGIKQWWWRTSALLLVELVKRRAWAMNATADDRVVYSQRLLLVAGRLGDIFLSFSSPLRRLTAQQIFSMLFEVIALSLRHIRCKPRISDTPEGLPTQLIPYW